VIKKLLIGMNDSRIELLLKKPDDAMENLPTCTLWIFVLAHIAAPEHKGHTLPALTARPLQRSLNGKRLLRICQIREEGGRWASVGVASK